MDFKFDAIADVMSAELLEAGVWEHLGRPGKEDEKLYADKDEKFPMEVLVRSYRSETFKAGQLAAQAIAANTRTDRGKSKVQRELDAVAFARSRNFALLAVSFRNMSKADLGKTVSPDMPDKIAMSKLPNLQWLVERVFAIGFDDGHFGLPTEDGEGNADGAAAEEPL